MIAFLHPGFLYAAAGVAAGLVALHFLMTQQPRTQMLPTVRFFPDVPVRATRVRVRLSDLLLLALRVLTVLLVGAAFAQPRAVPVQRSVTRIVAVVPGTPVVEQAAMEHLEGAASVIRLPGLSSALVAALREASRLRSSADSIALTIVSPFTTAEIDAATLEIRERFPGHIALVPVAVPAESATPGRPTVQWADSAIGQAPARWSPRSRIDTVGSVASAISGSGRWVLIHAFERKWTLATPTPATRVLGRWTDGEPAAIEYADGAGCIRSLAFALPAAGDLMLRPDVARLFAQLQGPCGVAVAAPLPAATLSALRGPAALAPSSAIVPQAVRMTPLVPWLLAAAAVVALLELVVRRRRSATVEEHDVQAAIPRAA